MNQTFIVSEKNQGKRLDIFLAEHLNQTSRSQIKKMIQNSQILLNQNPASVHHFLKINDQVEILAEKKVKPKIAEVVLVKPKIIYDGPDFLVLEKPSGLLVHATEKKEKNTLVDWLVKKYPAIKKVGSDKYRAGIIHRLDKTVSGIMVVAKTDRAMEHLKDQFKKRLVKKEYIAMVYGKVLDYQGEINLPIGRSQNGMFVAHPKVGSSKLDEQDKTAKTRYRVIEYIKEYTLLSVEILTGRTHQIRAHLTAIGHPIMGDELYLPKRKILKIGQRKIKIIPLPRIFLHSEKIAFTDLEGKWQEFVSPLPKELKIILDEKRKTNS